MKQKQAKLTSATLFVYRTKVNAKLTTETDPPTEPTTTMITLTKTGVFDDGRSK